MEDVRTAYGGEFKLSFPFSWSRSGNVGSLIRENNKNRKGGGMIFC